MRPADPAARPAPASVANTRPASSAGWRFAPWWVLAYVALWPARGVAEGVLVLGALYALVRLLLTGFRGAGALLSAPAWALTSVLFAAYWLPLPLSAFDAVDPRHALFEALVDLRYLPFLWLVAAAVADARGRRITFTGLGVIASAWTLDALLQAILGSSPLFFGLDALKQLVSGHGMCGVPASADAGRLSGVLGPCNLKLGIVLASLSPFVLAVAARLHTQRSRTLSWVLAAVLLGIVILLAGSRASWVTYGLVLLLSGVSVLGWKRLAVLFLAGALTVAVLSVSYAPLQERLQRTFAVSEGSEDGMDVALSGRVRIWGAALCMIEHHPFNGIGARGFREAFPACDPDAGQRPAWGSGPALHAHQLLLEVFSETGVIGLLLWLAGVAMALRAWRFATTAARAAARPAMQALLVTIFPLNTHLAFYSTFWGGVFLLLTALYAGSLLGRDVDGAQRA